MVEIRQPDYGLRDCIEKGRFDVVERRVNGLSVLDLVYPHMHAVDYKAVLSEGNVVGSKVTSYDWKGRARAFWVSVVGDQIRGYHLENRYVIVGARDQCTYFFDFLFSANPLRETRGPRDVFVQYTRVGGLFVPIWLSFGQSGSVLTENSLVNYDASQPTNQLTVRKEDEQWQIEVNVPEIIHEHIFNELEQILITDTGWLALPRQIPILYYSRIMRKEGK